MHRKVQVRFGEGRYRQTIDRLVNGSGDAYSTQYQSKRSTDWTYLYRAVDSKGKTIDFGAF
jgi:transposase-like protein